MKQRRSVDYDGLDGILRLPGAPEEKPGGYRSAWFYAAFGAALIGALLLANQNRPPSAQFSSDQTNGADNAPIRNYASTRQSDQPALENPGLQIPVPAGDRQNSPSVTEYQPEQPAAKVEAATATPITPPPAAMNSGILFTVQFGFDSSKLASLSQTEQSKLISAAKSCPNLIKLTGHTCNLGPAASNKQLGLARAHSVKKWLSANGFPAQNISIASAGMEQPAVANDTRSGQAQNRRVELTCQDG